MNVRELIELLKQCNDDTEVFMALGHTRGSVDYVDLHYEKSEEGYLRSYVLIEST